MADPRTRRAWPNPAERCPASQDQPGASKEVPLVREAPRQPVRTCVACRTARAQHELLRLARTPDGIRFDADGRLPGRGAYLCHDPHCLETAARRGASGLRRALRGGSEAEALAALATIRDQGSTTRARGRPTHAPGDTTRAQGDGPPTGPDEDVQHQVPDGTVRSENA
ncbi:YlxR family protein [Egicoccus sp. AB-alg2]|uniref:YlxR family protein n=1 Tax=Egicoccus sp. AB-alg2 TaxID=3242693 RepID=UPI00359F039F